MIAPEGGFDSIGNVFNYTLHRILDYGGSESDVKSILGAVKLSKKELKEKSFFFELDDGYVTEIRRNVCEKLIIRKNDIAI